MAARFANLRGTLQTLFGLGAAQDVQLKREAAAVLGVRDATDAAYGIARVADAAGDNDAMNRQSAFQQNLITQALGGF